MDGTWFHRALCRDYSQPEMFCHPEDPFATEQALSWCADCPVREECLAWATSDPNFVGVAGGRVFPGRSWRSRVKVSA